MLDQVNNAVERGAVPSANITKEVNDERTARQSLQPAGAAGSELGSASAPNTLELTDPYASSKGDAASSSPAESAGKNSEEKKAVDAAGNEQKDAAEKAGDNTDKNAGELLRRYDNSNIVQAFETSLKTGLPLVVQVGESWCPHCQHMESAVWPGIEGSADKSGDLQGKAVFLHLDFDKSQKMTGESGQLAAALRQGVNGFPTFKVLSISSDGTVKETGNTVGEMSQEDLEKFLKVSGVK